MRARLLAGLVLMLAAVATAGPASGATTKQLTVTGRIQVLDSVGGTTGHRAYLGLTSGHSAWRLQAPSAAGLPTGTIVRTTGLVSGHTFTAQRLAIVAAPTPAATTGTQSVYVIRVAWSGNAGDGQTSATIASAFGSAGAWFNEVSYGAIPGLATTVDPTYESISTPSSCDVPSGTDAIYSAAVTAAKNSNPSFNDKQYQHVVVYFPLANSGCAFAGLGEIGGGSVLLNGDITNRVTNHELGHNLGLYHSHAPICHSGSTQVASPPPGACDSLNAGNEYGDQSDVMGGSLYAGHYSASQKAQLGWFAGRLDDALPCAGAVTLKPYETLPGSGFVAARVAVGADATTHQPVTYWLEYRQAPAGSVDNGFNGNPVLPAGLTDGVLVHVTDPGPSAVTSYDIGPSVLDGRPSANAANADFSDAAVPTSGSVTTPQGLTIGIGSHDASGAVVTLTTSLPSVPRSPSAAVSGSGVKVSWQSPACAGTGGGAISAYHLTRVGGSTVDTTSTSATSPGVAGQSGAEYLVSATSGAGTGAATVVPASAPRITAVDFNVNGGVGFTFDTSASNGGRPIAYYAVHGAPVGNAPAVPDNYYDVTQQSDRHWYLIAGAGRTYDVTIVPVFDDLSRGPASKPVRVTVEDRSAPKPSVKAPTASFTLAGHATARWGATDSGGAGVQSYDLRYRVAPYSGGFGGFVSPPSLQKTSKTSTTLALAAGSTYCFSVRARDGNLNTSHYSTEKCTAAPLDDRNLVADSHWSHSTGAFYAGTLSTASHRGSLLTRSHVNARHLSVVATECPTCGQVGVYAGGTRLATLDLHSASTKNEVVLTVPLSSALHGATVTLKVLTNGKRVDIDGLGVRAV
jgi:hypothetical protein